MLQDNFLTQCAHAHAHTRTQLFVLVACEESQEETKAFRMRGHIAFSCDIQKVKAPRKPEWHIHGDCLPLLSGQTTFTTQDGQIHSVPQWDLIIAHPPCTYICCVSAIHLIQNVDGYPSMNIKRYHKMQQAVYFFNKCLQANAAFVAVENPLPMKIAKLPKPSFYACPSWFGAKYTKRTLYWVRNLPPLMPGCINTKATSLIAHRSGKYRSRTMPELANAIAQQWSDYILSQINKPK